ncbi:MAG: diheme cytochrome c [Gammaproteobacteria bacterium]|nr:diheme cytochrome c [Gammaproteobacteria bacterium]
MNKLRFSLLALAAIALGTVVLGGVVLADDDDDKRGGRRAPDVMPVEFALYQSECGSCHFAFQPGFLPARSWRQLMGGLADHFGDSAELAADDRQAIEAYLVTNAADRVAGRRSAKFMQSIGRDTPLRITEVRYFRSKHDEVPARLLKHEQIGSFSNCIACHTRAEQGSYAEREIRIPGIGRWED